MLEFAEVSRDGVKQGERTPSRKGNKEKPKDQKEVRRLQLKRRKEKANGRERKRRAWKEEGNRGSKIG